MSPLHLNFREQSIAQVRILFNSAMNNEFTNLLLTCLPLWVCGYIVQLKIWEGPAGLGSNPRGFAKLLS